VGGFYVQLDAEVEAELGQKAKLSDDGSGRFDHRLTYLLLVSFVFPFKTSSLIVNTAPPVESDDRTALPDDDTPSGSGFVSVWYTHDDR
jgi:hypothetical protein